MNAMTFTTPPGHYRFIGLARSEWTKLRTVRSTKWTLGLIVLLGVGLSAIVTAETSAHWSTMGIGSQQSFDPTQSSLIGVAIAQLVIGVLGVLVMSAEYGTGTIRATLAAAPKRPWVLVSKVAVFGTVGLIVSEAVSFLSYFLGQALLRSPAPHTTIGDPGALRAVFGAGLYLALIGLIALGLATIIRHTAGAIGAVRRSTFDLAAHLSSVASVNPSCDATVSPRKHRQQRDLAPARCEFVLVAVDRAVGACLLRSSVTHHRWHSARPKGRVGELKMPTGRQPVGILCFLNGKVRRSKDRGHPCRSRDVATSTSLVLRSDECAHE